MKRSRRFCAAMLVIAALVALVVCARLPEGPHYLYVLHKLGHPLAFGVIAWLLRNQRIGKPRYLVTLLLAVLIGGATELVQAAIGRDGRWSDVALDGLGAVAALALHACWYRRGTPVARRFALLAAALSLAVLAPLLWCAAAYANRALRFPVIAEFRTPLDRYFLTTGGAKLEPSRVPAGLRVIPDETGSGLGFHEPAPDWSGYRTLVVAVSNPNDAKLSLLLRIHDRQHNWQHRDRYNGNFEVAPHAQRQLRVALTDIAASPDSRQLDLRHIAGVALFVPRSATPRPFVVISLRLE